jgi:hypothetical protein
MAMVVNLEHYNVIVKFIEVVIWPLTILIVLIIYKKNFNEAFNRIGSLKADASGISFTFEKKIEAAKGLLKEINPKVTAKSVKSISVNLPKSVTSELKQLFDIQTEIDKKILDLAKINNLSIINFNRVDMIAQLEEVGIITHQKAKIFETIIDIIHSADNAVKQHQVDVVKDLFNKLN